jgi:hypothetical protein
VIYVIDDVGYRLIDGYISVVSANDRTFEYGNEFAKRSSYAKRPDPKSA